jgi:hypothetical protein
MHAQNLQYALGCSRALSGLLLRVHSALSGDVACLEARGLSSKGTNAAEFQIMFPDSRLWRVRWKFSMRHLRPSGRSHHRLHSPCFHKLKRELRLACEMAAGR